MNRSELVQQVAEQTGINVQVVKESVDTFFDGLLNSLKDGEPVNVVGFGKFETVTRAARTVRAFGGPPVEVPEKQAIKFTPSSGVKATIAGT